MKETSYRLLAVLVLSYLLAFRCASQNLVPNPNFEDYTDCPTTLGQIHLAPPWMNGNEGHVDYFHSCVDPGGIVDVPDNGWGHQDPLSGQAYSGVGAGSLGLNDYREYLMAPLLSPLIVGQSYLVSFYISLAEAACPIVPFGALFTVGPPVYDSYHHLAYEPQIETNGGLLDNYIGWTLVSRCFIADGGENYITIGNFRDVYNTPFDSSCFLPAGDHGYYFVEDVSVIEMPLSESEFTMDPVTVCGPYTINPGSAENYHWNDGTTNPTLTVTESGTYSVTLSNECAFSYGEIEVTIILDAPPVILPNDTVLCPGESIEIILDPDAGIYEWNDGNSNNEYTITEEGEYIVTLTDDCDETSDTINIAFLDPPIPFTLGEDTVICEGDLISISLDPDLGEFEWQDGSNSTTYTISEGGTYALTITSQCGTEEDEIMVTVVESIVFSLGPDMIALCNGQEIEIDLDPDLGDFLWHDNSQGNTFTISEGGTVSVTISNTCFTETDSMVVEVVYPPVFTLGPDLTVCSGEFPVTIDMSDVEHAESWEWTGGSSESVILVSTPGTYGVTISNDCFAMSDEIVVTVGDVDPVVTLPPDQLLCPGQTFMLDAGGLMGTYQWSTSTGSVTDADTFLVTEPGTYYLTVTNICGSGSDSVTIYYIPPLAPPDLGNDFSLCPGETGVLYAGVENVTYLWSEGTTGTVGTADSLAITSPGTYSVQIADGCTSASDTVIVTFNANPPDIDLPASVDLCQGDTVVIDAGVTGVQYLWNDASTGSATTAPELIVTTSGIYYLQVSNACGTDADTIMIIDAGPAPTVSLGADLSLCPGDVMNVIPVSSDVQSWLWHDSSTSSSFSVSAAGVVYVEASNQCGQAGDTIQVTMLPATPPLDLGADLSICPGETVTLTITEPNVDILWHASTGSAASDTTSTNPEFSLDTSGLITATISNACGSASDSVVVSLLDAAPTLDLGADQLLCPGEAITFDPGIKDVEYMWLEVSSGVVSTGSTTAITSPGTIILTISNDCGSATDTVI
ncbi:MAG TPA: hypothetical protein VI603_07015, partial [Saprospiraceae bacterium]|nr:hypothetical protein [Saprospiraceae bacterium]